MSEQININKNLSDEEIYKQILPQVDSLLKESEPLISSLSNLTSLLKDAFTKISWVGFYLSKNNKLYLGPFQGKIACTVIDFGKGVCGTSALNKKTIIVKNVHEFPGHIACDSGSYSEIVIPLIKDDNVVAVLDLDSYNFSAFNETDKYYLEKISDILINKFSFENLI
ncbi:MAG: GAF domain-containing protein [Melioribacteraceae bacterium]|nr:GAF domain-containing protein [Melioribacteraceae bacterium]